MAAATDVEKVAKKKGGGAGAGFIAGIAAAESDATTRVLEFLRSTLR